MSSYPVADISAVPFPASFRRQILKVLGCIFLFFATYLFLLAASILFAMACVWLGVWIIVGMDSYSLFQLFLGLALIVPGVMQVIFLVKFIFSRHKPQQPYREKLDEAAQPELFSFIRELNYASHTRFPKHIYLAGDVNAAVFYEPGLFSILLGRKSLVLGAGLVNSVNIGEFKMVLAHEFGHFSQRSMQVGTFVGAVNRVIYNMLYENTGWSGTIEWISQMGSLMNLFARLSIALASGVQYILQKLYTLLNRQHMALSREMEFHADAIALRISGTNNAVSAMRRIELSGFCFQEAVQQAVLLKKDHLRLDNFYAAHSILIRHYAFTRELPLDETGLPVLQDNNYLIIVKSRVQLRDQWASHPTHEEREARYIAADIPGSQVIASAWSLFRDVEQIQTRITAALYKEMFPNDLLTEAVLPMPAFAAYVAERGGQYAFPKVFNHYYERQFPPLPGKVEPLADVQGLSLATLYAPEKTHRLRCYFRDLQDAETLRAISKGEIQTRYFEIEGQRHPASEAGPLLALLQTAIEQEAVAIYEQDALAFRYHYTMAGGRADEVLADYRQILFHQMISNELNHRFGNILQDMHMLFNVGKMTLLTAQRHFDKIREEDAALRQLLPDAKMISANWGQELGEKVDYFLARHYTYLQGNSPLMEEVQALHGICMMLPEHYHNSILLLQQQWLRKVEQFSVI
jgi:Zn-dependent protease with chaperone function